MEDSYGFIWFGTMNSLISYDGHDYTTYKVSGRDSTGLTGYRVISLFEDRDRNIWAGTYGGLNRLNRRTGRFSHFYPDTADIRGPNNIIRLIAQEKNGYIWLITNRNIYRLNPNTGKFSEFVLDSLVWQQKNATLGWAGAGIKGVFLQDHLGKVWIGTPNGLFYYDPESGHHTMIRKKHNDPTGISHNLVTALVEDSRKELWISTMGGGLNLLTDRKTFAFRKFRHDPHDTTTICSDSILSLSLVPSGRLWIGCKGRLSMKLPGSKNFQSWIIQEFPEGFKWQGKIDVNEVFEDHNGGTWIFDRNLAVGQLFFKDRMLVFQDITNDRQHEICMDRAGSFWIGTIDNYTFRIDLQGPRLFHSRFDFFRPWIYVDTRGTIWAPDRNLTFNVVGGIWKIYGAQLPGNISFSAMHEDAGGNLWFVSDAIYKYNPDNKSMVTFRLTGNVLAKIRNSRVEFIYGDQMGNFWFGSRVFLACLNTNTGKADLISPANFTYMQDHDWQIEQVFIDSRNTVWIATLEGIYRIEPGHDRRFTRFIFNLSGSGTISDNAVFRIAEDKLGRLWVLTRGSGLHLFNRDSGTFTLYNLFADIPDISFNGMISDLKGNLWIFHSAGMSRFSPVDGTVRNFRLPIRNLNATINHLGNGNIYIVPEAADGTYIFHPDSIKGNTYVPPVYITSMLVNNNPVLDILDRQQESEKKRMMLNYRENSLTFTFSALNYTESENNRYKYRMIGQDNDTLLAGANHQVEYRKMRPGKYTFWVTGSNNDGIWNPAGTQISFTISHPFYTSAVAWVFYGILFLMLLFVYVRLRIRNLRLEKINLEKQVQERTLKIEEQKKQLMQKNDLITELDQIKTRFFTNISHEFRTPLTLIQGPVEEMLEQPRRTVQDRNFLRLIYRNTRKLLNLVNQLLDIAKIDSSKMKLELVEADVIDFLRTLAASFSSLAETRHINFIYQFPIVVRHTWFDRDKIEKIINNLLSNAFKFTSEGGNIKLSARYIDTEHGLPETLEFSVSDTGIGIPADLTDKIFDRFYQVEESLKREGGGTGLGLSLTRDLIQLMHGEITVTSEPGKGSTFKVKIPLGKDHLQPEEYTLIADHADVEKQTVRPQTPEIYEESRKDMQVQPASFTEKPVVLIVEDNKDIRQHIMQHFDRNFSLVEAIDGRAGWLIATEVMPELVITDLMMPHMDGTELCRQLKTDERTSHIPVIMLTARASLEDKLKGLETGADDYVSKPFNMKELLARSLNLVEQRRKLRERFSREITLEPRDVVITSVDEKFLQRAISVVESHISEEQFSVTLLCEAMSMSRSTLFRKLYALTGQSPVDFVNTIRLKRAAGLLRQHAGNVTVVALEVGFSNPSYFAKIFKKQFGIAPRQYAKA